MSKYILLKTNLFVSLIIVIGFAAIFTISYYFNLKVYMGNIEQVSTLTSEGIYYRMLDIFAEPVNVSMTMANGSFLKTYLSDEENKEPESFSRTIREYLNAYKNKYEYDSVFLVSANSGNYYTFNGLDRVMTSDNPENNWYYSFLEADAEYSLNVDNDEAAENEITVFVNCRITDSSGNTLGIVGVGFKVEGLQLILQEYAESFGVEIYFIDKTGNIEIAIDETGWEPKNFFTDCGYPQFKDEILANSEKLETLTYWHSTQEENNFIISRYIPKMEWHLIVEHNTGPSIKQMFSQLYVLFITAIVIIVIVVITITYSISRYNKQIIILTTTIEEQKHAEIKKHLIQKAEIDGLTGLYNKKATEQYISQLLADNPDKEFAFFILDLDNLKTSNDKHGHAFGDFVIAEFASSIRGQFRDTDIVGRVGGDEFVAFFSIPDLDFAYKKAETLSAVLDTTRSNGTISCDSSASIGVAVAPRDGTSFEELYKNADYALYDVKYRGKNGYAVYKGEKR